ncbi:tandem-95 repeat protein [Euzebya rosea]|uniref:tandem-95 repeat protein n=1 Tax=Euzebya rosea TaxID=2052804 RepID=UPI000D3E0322|nr:Ig-like domain-containing protein [Euzebya rosea]
MQNLVSFTASRLAVLLLLVASVLASPSSVAAQERQRSEIIVLGGPAAVSEESVESLRDLADDLTVVAGADRYETAVAIAAGAYPDGADVVFVATGEDFADALAIGPHAARSGGPILLTRPGDLPTSTEAEVRRLSPERIVVVGGPSAVGPQVEASLATIAPVVRIAGDSRLTTAVAVSAVSHPDGTDEVAIARADDFADALVAGPLMAERNGPILLTGTDELSEVTRAELLRLDPTRITILGGTAAVGAEVEAAVADLAPTVERIAGENRFETALQIGLALFGEHGAQRVYVVSGESFADALAGAAIAVRPDSGGFAQTVGGLPGPLVPVGPPISLGIIAQLLIEADLVFEPPTVADITVTTDKDTPVDITLDGTPNPSVDLPLTYAIDDLPSDADVTLDGDIVTFDPLGAPGARTFTYTASQGDETSEPATVTVEVTDLPDTPGNRAPTATDLAVTTDEDVPVVITMTGTDPDGDPLTFTAGAATSGTVVPGPGPDEVTYTPDPDTNGPDSFTYTASDGSRDSAPATVDITVTPVPDAPVAIDGSGTTDEDVDLVASVSGTDADGDVLAFAVDTAPTAGSLTAFDTATGAFTYTPTPNANGTDSFTFTVDDGSGPTAPGTFDITVTPVDDPPVANPDTITTNEDTPAGGTVTATSVDGGTITYALDTDATNGTATVAAGGAYTYTPDPDYNGPDSFTFSATEDGLASTATVSITVDPVADAPTADDQTLSTDEDVPVNGTLTGDDADGDAITFAVDPADPRVTGLDVNTGDFTFTPDANTNGSQSFTFRTNDGALDSPLATVTIDVAPLQDAPTATARTAGVDEDDSVVIALAGTDADGDPLVFAIDTDPTDGTVTAPVSTGVTSAEVTYTPNADFNGPDSFTFTVDDGTDTSAPATVDITVSNVNDPPTVDDASATTDEDVAVTVNLVGDDIDGDALTFTVVSGPTNGTVGAITPTGNETATVTYTPNGDYNGSDSFTVRANDGALDSSSNATVTITVDAVDDPPTATAGSENVDEDDSVLITLAGTDVDTADLAFALGTGPTNGTLGAISGSGVGQSATVTYTPNANYNGSDSFTFTVSDGTTTSAAATVSITVDPVDDAPAATAGNATVDEDDSVLITLEGTDPDGGNLTFTIGTGPSNGGLGAIGGNGAGQSATVTYTPNANHSGSDSFTFTVSDGTTTSAPATVSITVTPINDPPVAADDDYDAFGNTELIVVTDLADATPALRGPGVRIQGTLLDGDTDVDGDTLSAVAATGQATTQGGSVDIQADGTFVYTPAVGSTTTDTFTYTVTDGTVDDSGLATITLSELIWYVDADAAAGGDGRSHTPLDTMPSTVGAAGDIVYVGESATAVGGAGTTLQADQQLIGAGVALQVGLPSTELAPASTAPVITSTADGVTLGVNNTVRGIDIGTTSGIGLVGNSGFGTLSMSDVVISGTGRAISLIGGTMGAPPAGTRHIDSVDVVLAGGADRAIHTNQLSGALLLGTVDVTGTGHGLRLIDTGGVSIDSLDVDVTGIALQAQDLTTLAILNGTVEQERLHSSADAALDLDNIRLLSLTTDSVSSNSSGTGVSVSSTAGALTVEGPTTVDSVATTAIDIDSGPSVTFGGLVQAAGSSGLQLTGGTTTLSAMGGLQVSGTTGIGLEVGSGTTINVSGPGSTASSTSNTAVDITGTIGGSGVTFDSVTAGGGTHGIVLSNTGAGAFTVTGTGGPDSGGTISSTTGEGVLLTNTGGPISFTDIRITGTGNHGIRGTSQTGGFTGNRLTLTTIGNADDERGIWLTNPGTVTITDPSLTTIADTAIEIDRTTASTGDVTITATTPGPHIDTTANSGAGVEITAIGAGAVVPGGSIDGIDMTGIDGPAIRLLAGDTFGSAAGAIGTQGTAGTDSTGSFRISDVAVGTVAPFVAGAGGGGIQIRGAGNGTMDVDISDADIVTDNAFMASAVSADEADVVVEIAGSTLAMDNPAFNAVGVGAALVADPGQSPVLHTTITNTAVGVAGQVGSAGSIGVAIEGSNGTGAIDAILSSTTIVNSSSTGVLVDRGIGANVIRSSLATHTAQDGVPDIALDVRSDIGTGGTLDLAVTNSTLTGQRAGMFATIDDGAAGCLDISANSLTSTLGFPGADIAVGGTSTLEFPDYAGGNPEAYLTGRNTLISAAPIVTGAPTNGACIPPEIR